MRRATTARILAERALRRDCGQECVDWALAMLEEGRDGHHLAMLAGETPPHDALELQRLRDGALRELGIPEPERQAALSAYASECVRALCGDEAGLEDALDSLRDLYLACGSPDELQDFYLLHWAYSDLREQEVQWYWEGADRTNIVAVVRQRAEAFLRAHGDRSAH